MAANKAKQTLVIQDYYDQLAMPKSRKTDPPRIVMVKSAGYSDSDPVFRKFGSMVYFSTTNSGATVAKDYLAGSRENEDLGQ